MSRFERIKMQCQDARNLTNLDSQIRGGFRQGINHPRKTVLARSCAIGSQDIKEVDWSRSSE